MDTNSRKSLLSLRQLGPDERECRTTSHPDPTRSRSEQRLSGRCPADSAAETSLVARAGAPLTVECPLRVEQRAEWRLNGSAPPADMQPAPEQAAGEGRLLARLHAPNARAHHQGVYTCSRAPDARKVRVTFAAAPLQAAPASPAPVQPARTGTDPRLAALVATAASDGGGDGGAFEYLSCYLSLFDI